MVEVKSKEAVKEPIIIKATGTVDRIVPKICTTINFQVTNNSSFVVSMTYADAADQPQTLIERIVIDHELAKNVSKVLNTLLEQIEKKQTEKK